ncbi:outer membrane protein assembly factor BamE [Jannaschia sp. W003]|uniref:outer membrane protein assembly factor BamE n=1 Tax=Jannaschia sp. W003 TaxID=2867012 RepID=UPI0021A345FD|nr:outer membrane protein assembly factor BamE [Jannaschia sp. W003]UWQ20707.1 outer membrane protein assembly factor BamE [Jannaschia sp. W003]
MHPRTIAAALALAALAACAPTFRNHGYAPDPDQLARLRIGADTRETVEGAVGRPSAAGVLGADTWYYVEERRRQFGPSAPVPIRREVVAISFAPDGRLRNVERFGLEAGRVVPLSRRVTTSTIRDFGLLQQLLRNLGRVDVGEALADAN